MLFSEYWEQFLQNFFSIDIYFHVNSIKTGEDLCSSSSNKQSASVANRTFPVFHLVYGTAFRGKNSNKPIEVSRDRRRICNLARIGNREVKYSNSRSRFAVMQEVCGVGPVTMCRCMPGSYLRAPEVYIASSGVSWKVSSRHIRMSTKLNFLVSVVLLGYSP